ncbi:hypothetical protein Forpe1208_v016578 [Fusarium oxysporum f. sp. rapae]|uniref:Secreted in xylem 10 n=1 Tax=Fusarium oxysporum f. sp. rapae TaxID=485398 RepID=A0A8J5TX61_FUSOX|nr:hypothetical protein Forpe1208_v016578 [Fusarium oxysporum f. sp. rapae]
MRYSTLIAALQIAGLALASPVLSSRDVVLTPPSNQGVPPSIDARDLARREPIEPLIVTEIQTAEHGLDASGLQKRTLNIRLRLDTGSAYRATYNGLAIIIHIFYDLAVNHVVFYWDIDGTNPAPGQLTFGFKDRSTNLGTPARAYTHDTRYNLGRGFKQDDIISIFK